MSKKLLFSSISGKKLFILFLFSLFSISTLFAQESVNVTGKVTDEKGLAMPAVSIKIKGTTQGVSTDANGIYAIKTTIGSTLVFQYLSYNAQEVVVSKAGMINIKLVESNTKLEEVVVVGYGTQKKGNVTGAIATFKADKLDERPILRVDQALVGQMAGVSVKQTSGTPGKAFSIQVRGTGSISAGNEPLYVLDGFPLASASPNGSGNFATGNPLDNINPNDIESIQVLKDASASAIYGSRAANGVVLITTKRGKSGKPTITLNTYAGTVERSKKLDMLNGAEWIDRATEMINAQWVASGTGRTASQTTDQRRAILGLAPGAFNVTYMLDDRWTQPGYGGLNVVDWQDEIFRTGITQNYQLGASGATETVNYYVSGNYVKQQGMVVGMDYESYSARANVEIKANDKLKFGVNLAPTYSVTNDPGVEGKDNILHQALSMSPIQQDLPGNVNVFNNTQYIWSVTTNDPLAKLNNTIGMTKKFRTLGTVFGEYKILDGLTFKTTVNLDNTDNTSKSYTPYTVTGSLSTRTTSPNVGTSGSYGGYRKRTFVNENTLSYVKTFHEKHDFSVLVGQAYNSDKLENVSLSSVGGFGVGGITTLGSASVVNGSTSEAMNVLLSYFGRLQYSFDQKYLFSASIRRDGSSRFGINNQYGVFPSVSAGWNIAKENFLKDSKKISELKLRVSYGESGNYNIGDYSSRALLGSSNYTFNGVPAYGQALIGVANPNLSWEKSKTTDIGLDMGFFQNRITASVDYYNKLNTDLLLNVPIPEVTGFGTQLSNTGSVRNKGLEFEVSTRNLTGSFQWNTSLNASHNSNKVVSLAAGQSQILIPSSFDVSHSILKVGEPMYAIYAVRQLGILSQQDIDNKAALFGTQTVGDPKYKDANGDGVIDANDREIVGKPNPDWTYGVTNTFRYKGFDLTVLVQGQTGGSIYSLLGRALGRTGQGVPDNALGFFRDRWRSPDNPGAGEVGKAYSTFGRIINTDWLYSSNYVRVRNITLGYDLGKQFKSKAVKGARIYVTAENYFGHDSYKGGFNPEASNTNLSGSDTFPEAGDYGGLPLPKSLILGLNFTF
ncbi:TonB-linked outer membrane protein, SusC/RagA family [Pedobacter westerhofensis]|uniref:TonB-linked outer membrane protein, SusC/RagA family n=1 Tax=Pedobacter westerhofensis TaxID=425512 RepID=A0A521FE71_9SPHI|nr:TonB-dependent receptor [Pedobacter westerhofensis]SMO93840.1 TonB-linked outer membrane protein, SusC/RagA family [Pedobacter westerhofensis]